MEADAIELRVLGSLIEKQRTTPDAYPLSINSIRLAANQSTNRDPVMQLDESQIRDALAAALPQALDPAGQRRGSRASKYRHLLDEALGVDDAELRVLAVLMLRGPQTPGELNQRVARLHAFGSMDELQATLGRLMERDLVGAPGAPAGPEGGALRAAPRRHGRDRGPRTGADPPGRDTAAGPSRPAPAGDTGRLERLEREVAELRAEVAELREALGG